MAEATERDLIPTGLPYGERQKTEERMRAAGVPLGTGSVGGRVGPQDLGSTPGMDVAMQGFDALTAMTPTQPQTLTPATRVRGGDIVAVLEASPNPVAQMVARRLRGR